LDWSVFAKEGHFTVDTYVGQHLRVEDQKNIGNWDYGSGPSDIVQSFEQSKLFTEQKATKNYGHDPDYRNYTLVFILKVIRP
jgi:hypothetical protein